MVISKEKLESLAAEYADGMTSIRGRRVKKFILREFFVCIDVSIHRPKNEIATFIGALENGDILEMQTDGKGSSLLLRVKKNANTEIQYFSLLKDSLPLVQ